jgi:predicted metalloprotease with PDZ domain
MKYLFSYTKPHNHFIDIEFIADVTDEQTIVQLPAWRPGRYELGNFAKNIQKWAAFDEKGNTLKFNKLTKDSWSVDTKGVKKLQVKYNYYAAEINAGSSFLDATQLYVNPVNCCIYIPEKINEKCELELQLPADYKVACGLPVSQASKFSFVADSFHDLADSPFIASATLQHNVFVCEGVEFNFWFQGECKPEWSKLNNDFIKFCNHQLEMMKAFPVKRYHFLFQILPYKFYHGVEHITSTVIALGPGYNLMKGDLYENLLGVSSHELFHVWNVKTIRPIEMQPYDYTKENYSKLGYVCEGLTTYYGDYLLYRSGVFNEQQYFKTLNERLQKHFDNFGRFNLSVADSSFDTWLDGYVPGIPNRKTNIYDEGNLLALATDIFIRKNSKNKNSLDDVMRYLYNEFALKNKGYSGTDYKAAVEKFAGVSYDEIFNTYINGTADYEPLLKKSLDYIGCELVFTASSKFHESKLGFKITDAMGAIKISAVYPNSQADTQGLAIADELLAVNHIQVKADGMGQNFTEWCNYFNDTQIVLTISSSGIIKQIKLEQDKQNIYYKTVSVRKNANADEEQRQNFEKWSMNKF